MILLLRLLAECESEAHAAPLAARFVARAAAWQGVLVGAPERNREWPGLYEFTLALEPPTDATFDAVLAGAPAGWSHFGDDDDRSAVWNRAPGAELFGPEVRWAELLRHRGSAG